MFQVRRRTVGVSKGPAATVATLVLLVAPGAALARDAATWPFASNSPWNMPIGSGARYGVPGSNACSTGVSDPNLATDVNAGQWSQLRDQQHVGDGRRRWDAARAAGA